MPSTFLRLDPRTQQARLITTTLPYNEIVMAKARRAPRQFRSIRIETLETRSLLSTTAGSGPWLVGPTVNASTAIMVKFNASTTPSQSAADLATVGGRVVTQYPAGPELVALPPWSNRDAVLSQLKASADVSYAEADATVHADAAVIPNNPLFNQQWGMSYVDAPSAWGVTTGSSSVIIAVLDTGLDTRNPAFAGRLWTNPNPGTGGYRGDIHGWNFVSNNANILDNNGHGTHVTGILGATGNNGVGVAGINWQAKIMPLKVLDSQGNGSTDTAVSAVYYAVQHGAKVINASWGGDIFSQSMQDALNYADRAGVMFVTAAGNDSSNNDQFSTYPASFRTPNEMVVAAIDPGGNLADYSNYGITTVDIAAPGTNVLSTVLNNQYQQYTGTSMATPFVTGTAALLAGIHPTWSPEQIIAQIKATAKPDPQLNGLIATPGVVDPYFALTNATSVSASSTLTLIPDGTSKLDVEAAILTTSDVYNASGANPSSYVAYVYQSVVGREPSAADVNYFANALQNGLSKVSFVRTLENSAEAQQTEVARFFQNELGSNRTLADLKSDPSIIYLAGLLGKGVSRSDLVATIMSSGQFYQNTGGNNTAYVTYLYQSLLGRAPDASGLSTFTNALATGMARSDVVKIILASPEGRQTSIARFYIDDLNWPSDVVTLKGDPGVDYWASFLASA